jgi:2,4'-dihydroxyacetophenone dioxygenase
MRSRLLASPPVDTAGIPWVPLGPGLSFKPVRFLWKLRGRIVLLRLEPGTLIPTHRHGGEVHAFNLSGQRKLLESGEVVGAGGYVYEPPGNVDSWMAVGDGPLIVHLTAYGAVEYLGENGEVRQRETAATLLEAYHRHCDTQGLAPLDLLEREDYTALAPFGPAAAHRTERPNACFWAAESLVANSRGGTGRR